MTRMPRGVSSFTRCRIRCIARGDGHRCRKYTRRSSLLPDGTAHALAQVTAEKVEALAAAREVDVSRFLRMQLQTETRENRSYALLGLLARRLRVAHDHEVVRVAHQHAQMRVPARPHGVEHVQVDVRQQRRNHAALRRARDGRAHLAVFHHACLEPLPQQFEHPPVRDAPRHELSSACRGRCSRSSRGCRRRGRDCRLARHACASVSSACVALRFGRKPYEHG